MTETDCLQRMVPPSKPRSGAWRGGIIQIHITRACDLGCCHCTQGSNFGGRPNLITLDEFERACQSLQGYWGVVGMFGGNPAVHPQFEQLCEILCNYFPFAQRGLWCNHPRGHGAAMRTTFNPHYSNLNVHLSQEAYEEFKKDWPESRPFGLTEDSLHSPPFVALKDIEPDEGRRWDLISRCDVNQYWSAMVCAIPNRGLRGFFCEVAGAQALLHAHDPGYPDLGINLDGPQPLDPPWWNRTMEDSNFVEQARWHCHRCGIPSRGLDREWAASGDKELVSISYAELPPLKSKERQVVVLEAGGKNLSAPVPKPNQGLPVTQYYHGVPR